MSDPTRLSQAKQESPTPESIQDVIEEQLPQAFKDRVARCLDDGKAFAVEGLRLADEFEQLLRTFEILVPNIGYPAGYHDALLNAARAKISLDVVSDLLGGVAERAIDAIGGYPGEEGIKRCRAHLRGMGGADNV